MTALGPFVLRVLAQAAYGCARFTRLLVAPGSTATDDGAVVRYTGAPPVVTVDHGPPPAWLRDAPFAWRPEAWRGARGLEVSVQDALDATDASVIEHARKLAAIVARRGTP